ncbi:MAG: YkgJ family cysteine cluster protein [Candidatus Micrarchaeota archaeon]|nr:YkgJ family cysteine cluster protein [Candidatus Micrarchaeota archaeon]
MGEISSLIKNSCRHCTAKCCRGLAVVLTIPEAKRLVQQLGMMPEEFLEFSCNIDSKKTPHYPLLVQSSGKIEEYFILLKRRQKKDCIFLQKDCRCSIYEKRPAVCKLYPFELDGKKVKKNALCPVKFEKEEWTEVVAGQLKKDLFEHGKIARQWQKKFGDKAPDMRLFCQYF